MGYESFDDSDVRALFDLISTYGGKDIGSYKGVVSYNELAFVVETNEGGHIPILKGGIGDLTSIRQNVNSNNEMMRTETRQRLEGYAAEYSGPARNETEESAPFGQEGMHEAFDAIHDTALLASELLDDNDFDQVRKELDLIVSLSRYKYDVRSTQEKGRHKRG